MRVDKEFEKLLKHVINIFKDDDLLRKDCLGFSDLTTLGLANAAGNHIFDDHPEWFYITEEEGHLIRSFFQSNDINNPVTDKYVTNLIVCPLSELY